MSLKSVVINGISYHEIDSITVKVPDSFVDSQNKMVTKSNMQKAAPSTGETRLYVGSETQIKQINFFGNFPNSVYYYGRDREALPSDICFFSHGNLFNYLFEAEKEYYNPTQDYFYEISTNHKQNNILLRNIRKIAPKFIPFTLFHHDGKQDQERFYVNSKDDIWEIFRKIVLPLITDVTIYKMADDNSNIIYYFEVDLHKQFKSAPLYPLIEYRSNRRENISATEKFELRASRYGQGTYKNNLIQTMDKCPFTGIKERYLLRAGHIKPWAVSNNFERLDGFNGILLTPTYDVLFDRGLITFRDNGELLISPMINEETRKKLDLEEGKIYDIANSNGERNQYLEYHRRNVFKNEPPTV